MSKVENKAVHMGDEIEAKEEKYFFPDVNGQSITVKAKSREEALEKAKKLTNKK